jgi:surface carbohydrate biosynthesis protein (TIGR04326 family)
MRGQIKAWKIFWHGVRISFQRVWEVRRHFSKKMPKIPKDKPVYLLKSFVFSSSFSKNGHFKDPFFGKLPDFLRHRFKDSAEVLTLVHGFEKRPLCYKRMKSNGNRYLVPLEGYIRYHDIIRAILSLAMGRIFRPFRVKGCIPFSGYDISALIKEMLTSDGWQIQPLQYLHGAAGERLSRNYRIHACALTFEGNPWEKVFLQGLKKENPHIPTFGYQHAVVPMSAAGVFLDKNDSTVHFLPDRILTTGQVSLSLLTKYGQIPEQRIKPACALRNEYLFNTNGLCRRSCRSSPRILVALEGVQEVLPLVQYVFQEAKANPQLQFVVRSHPALPFQRLLALLRADIHDFSNIEISKGRTVFEDVADSDAVLYWGTTIALEAIMMGRPVIHFDRGDVLSYDPLFALECFKWAVSAQDDLLPILRQILQLPDKIYNELSDTARRYVKAYFQPVNEEAMGSFLPTEV